MQSKWSADHDLGCWCTCLGLEHSTVHGMDGMAWQEYALTAAMVDAWAAEVLLCNEGKLVELDALRIS